MAVFKLLFALGFECLWGFGVVWLLFALFCGSDVGSSWIGTDGFWADLCKGFRHRV